MIHPPAGKTIAYHQRRIFEQYPQLGEFHEKGLEAIARAPQSSSDLAGLWEIYFDEEAHEVAPDGPLLVTRATSQKLDTPDTLFLDIDEVFRDTAGSLMRIAGLKVDRPHNLAYDKAFDTDTYTTPVGTLNIAITGILDDGAAFPMRDIGAAATILDGVKHGTRIIGVTSTLTGGEAGTVRFMADFFAGILDGIGFNGHYLHEAAHKKSDLMKMFLGSIEEQQNYIGFIDDSGGHIADFRNEVAPLATQVRDVTPLHAMNAHGQHVDSDGKTHMLNHVPCTTEGVKVLIEPILERLSS